ncbi:hypothetical protein [Streptomyces sp. NPDC089919]|uniref:effector-associated constant component EACC1 n=1 Tax=Streptomyces sp. NPDC089919 TaxID=3155188 RepID=UPI00342F4BA1
MELVIGVVDPEESAAVRDFYRWLCQEDEPPGRFELTSRPVPGSMGGGLDVINLALTHAVAVGNLALAYAGWRRARRSRAVLTVTRPSDGLTVTVEDGSPETVQRLLSALTAEPPAVPAPTPPGPGATGATGAAGTDTPAAGGR